MSVKMHHHLFPNSIKIMPDEFLTNFRDPSVSKPMISKAPCKNKQMLCDIPGSRDKMKMKAYGRETNSGDMECVSFLVSSFLSRREERSRQRFW